MNWTKDKSIKLTKICVYIAAALLLLTDILAYPFLFRWIFGQYTVLTPYIIYIAGVAGISVFAWMLLWALHTLLHRIEGGSVFTSENVALLRKISWCCTWIALICFAAGLICAFIAPFPFLFFGAAAAGFMALIVRVVKNVFQQALDMKSELDLTI